MPSSYTLSNDKRRSARNHRRLTVSSSAMLSVCVLREHSIILLRGHSCDVIIVSLKKNAKKFERLSKRCNQLFASCRKQLIQIAINFESFIEHAAANKEK